MSSPAPKVTRPASFNDLMIPRGMAKGALIENGEQNRFIVVNLEALTSELKIAYTAAADLLKRARSALVAETSWPTEYAFDFNCSKMQLQSQAQREGKWPGKAATIIVALELSAKEAGNPMNIYERTGILRCDHFVDAFDTERLAALTKYYDALSESDRISKFGPSAAGKSFEMLCLAEMEQPFSYGLPSQMADGECAPERVCKKLAAFLDNPAHFPAHLHTGGALVCGSPQARNLNLGTGNAAKALRYSRDVVIADLVP